MLEQQQHFSISVVSVLTSKRGMERPKDVIILARNERKISYKKGWSCLVKRMLSLVGNRRGETRNVPALLVLFFRLTENL